MFYLIFSNISLSLIVLNSIQVYWGDIFFNIYTLDDLPHKVPQVTSLQCISWAISRKKLVYLHINGSIKVYKLQWNIDFARSVDQWKEKEALRRLWTCEEMTSNLPDMTCRFIRYNYCWMSIVSSHKNILETPEHYF